VSVLPLSPALAPEPSSPSPPAAAGQGEARRHSGEHGPQGPRHAARSHGSRNPKPWSGKRDFGFQPPCSRASALSTISAATAASAGSASSSGAWLIPSRHGTNTIPQGARSATHIVSCAAPEGIRR